MGFGKTTTVLADRMLKYYRISHALTWIVIPEAGGVMHPCAELGSATGEDVQSHNCMDALESYANKAPWLSSRSGQVHDC